MLYFKNSGEEKEQSSETEPGHGVSTLLHPPLLLLARTIMAGCVAQGTVVE